MCNSKINLEKLRAEITRFDNLNLKNVFPEFLGWESSEKKSIQPITVYTPIGEFSFEVIPIAQLSRFQVFNLQSNTDSLPNNSVLKEANRRLSEFTTDFFIIFTDRNNNQCWFWGKIEKDSNGKNITFYRTHYLLRGQTGELFIPKILVFLMDIENYNLFHNVKERISKVKNTLFASPDTEKVIKKFYREYQIIHLEFSILIQGIDSQKDREWYAGVLLNRLMFIYFLQKKGFIDNQNLNYLTDKLTQSQKTGKDLYYRNFLRTLFFEGFSKPEKDRNPETNKLLGKIVYLNLGLFLPHRLELIDEKFHNFNENLFISDKAFENVFKLLDSYSWNLNDLAGGKVDEMSPDVLGYIFEKYINQKEFGAYYTKPEITEYLCEETIYPHILKQINRPAGADLPEYNFDSIENLLINADADLIKKMIGLTDKGILDPDKGILTQISILDPACGSGAFLVAALKKLDEIYSALYSRIDQLDDDKLKIHKKQIQSEHPSLSYYIKKRIIIDNLYGVDINAEAVEIARLRLFIYLVASVKKVNELEPLPNIDFNLMAGNSLIGLLNVDDLKDNSPVGFLDLGKKRTDKKEKSGFPDDLGNDSQALFRELLIKKERLIKSYKYSEKILGASSGETLLDLRETINKHRREANFILNNILWGQMESMGIKYEKATWDTHKNRVGKITKETLTINHITDLNPFHWGFEFHSIMKKGGFDILLGNPPWEVLKPQDKEFLRKHSDLVTKNKMTIKDLEVEKNKLLKEKIICEAYLNYLSNFPYQSAYYRSVPQYKNQSVIVNGKKTGTDINLFKLFTEQFYNLLKTDGFCGIVIPSGIYTDLGTKGLRDLLFNQNQVKGLFGFENKKRLFENVDSRFKFVTLTFEKVGETTEFQAAFMRHDPSDLILFRQKNLGLTLQTNLVKRLSPYIFSIMEIKNEWEARIVEKMMKFPFLGEKIEGSWNVKLSNEFHMTNDSHLFRTEPGPGRLPLYEGKMIHQFRHDFATPRYWVDEAEGRKAVLGKTNDEGQRLDYQEYRLAYRTIAGSTNQRTMIMMLLPANVFYGNSLNADVITKKDKEKLSILVFLNSFVIDFYLRTTVTANLNTHYIYQLPIPRLLASDPNYQYLVDGGAKLVCTDVIYAPLWEEVMGHNWAPEKVITNEIARTRLRAEMDARVARIYGLTDEEFLYILSTFPAVDARHKEWALEEFNKQAVC